MHTQSPHAYRMGGLCMPIICTSNKNPSPPCKHTAERDDLRVLLFGFFDGVTTKTLAQGGEHFGRI
jgi:hypothetical protein